MQPRQAGPLGSRLRPLVLALALEATGARADAAAATPPGDSAWAPVAHPIAAVDRFLTQRAVRTRSIHVRGLTLERDAARIALEDGDLWLCEPIAGRVLAAVFRGAGTMTVTPPTPFERNELVRFGRAPVLTLPIRTLALIFADSTAAELTRGRPFTDTPVPGEAARSLKWFLDSVGEPRSGELVRGMAWPYFNGRANGYFFAYADGGKDQRWFFEIDPLQHEEVSLWRVPPAPFLTLQSLSDREVVCRFPRGGVYDTTAVSELRPDLAVREYRLDCVVSSVLGFSAQAELQAKSLLDREDWIRLDLFSELDVDSVDWDGTPASFARRDQSQALWVRPPSVPGPGEDHVLRIAYHGDLFTSTLDWIQLRSPTGWYPSPGSREPATFDMTFHHPAEFLLRPVGEPVSFVPKGDASVSRWVVRQPARNATFVLGRFDERSFGAAGIPRVSALIYQGKPHKVLMSGGRTTLIEGGKLEDWVVDDAAKCAAFYQQRLGPAQAPSFVVGQIPALEGEAFPGLINIPQTAFAGATAIAEDQVFRSHEVAHQWWGCTVAARTYHDHWLEEGFADFSGLWYLQSGLGHNRDYLDVLHAWGEELIRDREVRPEHGRQAGPIWLGSRNASRQRPNDYALIDSKKGAWVLQMLRSMLLDLDTMDDSRFSALMRDFYRSYAGRTASTEDFRRLAEQHAGRDLGWFFDQWVYRTGLPTFRFASNTERLPDGRYLVSCRVEQSGMGDDFRMPVTLRVEFGKDQFAWVRRVVAGRSTRFELPAMAMPPTRIVFADVASVLGRVKDVAW